MVEKFVTLPVLLQMAIITSTIFGIIGLFLFLVKLIAQKSVDYQLAKRGLVATEFTGLYASQAVYAVHVSRVSSTHPLKNYTLFAEADGNILLRVIGGDSSSDYPPSWPEHNLRCAIEIFGSRGIFPPGSKAKDNIVNLREKELTLVPEEQYLQYLLQRQNKSRS